MKALGQKRDTVPLLVRVDERLRTGMYEGTYETLNVLIALLYAKSSHRRPAIELNGVALRLFVSKQRAYMLVRISICYLRESRPWIGLVACSR